MNDIEENKQKNSNNEEFQNFFRYSVYFSGNLSFIKISSYNATPVIINAERNQINVYSKFL